VIGFVNSVIISIGDAAKFARPASPVGVHYL
jgi:hypothetical protein